MQNLYTYVYGLLRNKDIENRDFNMSSFLTIENYKIFTFLNKSNVISKEIHKIFYCIFKLRFLLQWDRKKKRNQIWFSRNLCINMFH